MNSSEFTDRFFSIERRLNLFADQGLGPFWWNTVRFEVWYEVYRRLTANPVPAPPRVRLPRRLWNRLVRQLLAIRLWLCIRTRSYDVLIFRAPRQIQNGRRRDLIIDDLVALCPGRKLVIDTFPHYYHRITRAPRAKELPQSRVLDSLFIELSTQFNDCLNRASFEALIRDTLAEFVVAEAAYLKLLRRTGARLIIMIQNGVEKAMFSAARMTGTVVVEAQHATIHAHPSYSYADDIDYSGVPSFPSIFLTLSDYWQKACHFPADRCVCIGNDNFYCAPLPPPGADGEILVLSAHIYHAKMSEWLMQFAPLLQERRIIYKLHPSQYGEEDQIRREFTCLSNVSVIGSDITTRQLLSKVSDVVLITSTVAYEALQVGCRVHIIPAFEYYQIKDLFDLPGVAVHESVKSLVDAIKLPLRSVNAPLFFEPLDRPKAQALLTSLLRSDRAHGARDGS